MKDKHIINLLESAPLAELSESDLSEVRAHASVCAGCRQAFEAAQIAALLLKERAAETFEPPPFFHTRVLASLRERRAKNEQWAWGRMWRAAGALASSMAVTVAALGVLTIALPDTQTTTGPETTFASSTYAAEEVILNQSEAPDAQVSDGYILTTLYGSDEEAVK
ncbi:MAG: anti-sigma factor family protein [Pyrinomonadaceae bacterium]